MQKRAWSANRWGSVQADGIDACHHLTRRRAKLGLGTLAFPPLVRSLPRRPLHVCAFGPRPGRWAQSKAVASASQLRADAKSNEMPLVPGTAASASYWRRCQCCRVTGGYLTYTQLGRNLDEVMRLYPILTTENRSTRYTPGLQRITMSVAAIRPGVSPASPLERHTRALTP